MFPKPPLASSLGAQNGIKDLDASIEMGRQFQPPGCRGATSTLTKDVSRG